MANTRNYIPVDQIFSVCDDQLSDISSSNSKVKTHIDNFEKKAKLNFNKSYPAPAPPGKQMHLPKIGNYQPKILLSQTSREETKSRSPERRDVRDTYDRPLQEIKIEDTSGRDYDKNDKNELKKGYVLMGDVDAPYVIHKDNSDQNSSPDDHRFSTNPLFEAENGDGDGDDDGEFDKSVKNPLYDDAEYQSIDDAISPHSPASPRSPRSPTESQKSFEYPPKEHPVAPPRYKKKDKPHKKQAPPPPPPPVIAEVKIVDKDDNNDYPYIPPPDYDENELTMDFNEEDERPEYGGKIFKEFEGDDFSRYLNDEEDYEFDAYTWRKNIRFKQKPRSRGPAPARGPAPPRPKSDINYSQNKKSKTGGLKPLGKPKHEIKNQSVSRSTIRDFSFADSKLSGDRSVRSTSAIGRYAKRGKERPRIETTEGSYEEFLRMRQTENGSNSSGDSGNFSGDETNNQHEMFLRSQPKEMRQKYKDDKPHSVWQKLTWKFKRHAKGYQMS